MFLCKVHYKIQFLLLRSLEFYGRFYDYFIVIHVAMENPPLFYHGWKHWGKVSSIFILAFLSCDRWWSERSRNSLLLRLQFSSLLSHVWLFGTPWTAARQSSWSSTNSQSLLMSNEQVMLQPPTQWTWVWASSGGSDLDIVKSTI